VFVTEDIIYHEDIPKLRMEMVTLLPIVFRLDFRDAH
jgi:hypothetical protein